MLLGALCALLLSACAATTASTSPPLTASSALPAGTWGLIEIPNEVARGAAHWPTIEFRAEPPQMAVRQPAPTESVRGITGCNTYFAGLRRSASGVTIDDVVSATNPCEGAQQTMETAIIAAMGETTAINVTSTRLELRNAQGNVLAAFRPLTAAEAGQ